LWSIALSAHALDLANRVAGEFDVVFLTLGFVLEFVGYSLGIGDVTTTTGGARLLAAPGMAAIGSPSGSSVPDRWLC
jgi:hypothetical protein